MLYNKNNLNVAKIADAGNAIKPALGSVFFSKKHTVATDSFKLLEVSVDEGLKVEDYPAVDKKTAMRGFKPFMANAMQLKDIKIPKNKNLPILESVAIKHIDDRSIEFLTTDLEVANTTKVMRVDDKFPDYEQLFPIGEPQAIIKINGKFLKSLLEVMTGVDEQVEIKFYAKDKPLVLECGGREKYLQKARGLLMPIRDI